ncbi:MAG: sulfite exporter TauE/SafE family protein [Candidatus Eremiobacteraeota bacterium]|nr:sulfite exporter TauE/SafE family protein [Candidatus Eremiobacteraeota bacterium]
MEYIIFILIGIGISIYGTLIGVGGGFILVPVLLLFYHFNPVFAVGTSLMVIFLNALSGTTAYLKQGKIDMKSGWWFVVATFPGTVTGSFLTRYFSTSSFQICFGIMLVMLSIGVFFRGNDGKISKFFARLESLIPGGRTSRDIKDSVGDVYSYRFSLLFGILVSFLVGFVAGMFGIGGGVIRMPAMLLLLNFPVSIAVATSQFVLTFTGFFGATTHYLLGNIKILPGICLGIGAIIGAQFGAYILNKVRTSWVCRLLALALFVVGIKMMFFH